MSNENIPAWRGRLRPAAVLRSTEPAREGRQRGFDFKSPAQIASRAEFRVRRWQEDEPSRQRPGSAGSRPLGRPFLPPAELAAGRWVGLHPGGGALPLRPPPLSTCRAGIAGRGPGPGPASFRPRGPRGWAGPLGRGRGAGSRDPASPRTRLELQQPPPASSRSHRFLSRDPGSAAMSAADEVDGLGVARPHYGCECGVRGAGLRPGRDFREARRAARGWVVARTRKTGPEAGGGGPRLAPGLAGGTGTPPWAGAPAARSAEIGASGLRWRRDVAGRVRDRGGALPASEGTGPGYLRGAALGTSLYFLGHFLRQNFKS